jgi:type I restriction enzyme, R subunit
MCKQLIISIFLCNCYVTEQQYEKQHHRKRIEEIAIAYLQKLGYSYLPGPVISPDGEHPERQYSEVVLKIRLRDAIDKLNPSLKQDAKDDALKKVLRTQ